MPPNLLALILKVLPHRVSGESSALRVESSHALRRSWYVPANQRAVTIGLVGGQRIVSWWEARAGERPVSNSARPGFLAG